MEIEIDITKGNNCHNTEKWDDGTIAQWTKAKSHFKVAAPEGTSKLTFYIPTAVGSEGREAYVTVKRGSKKIGEGKLKLGNIGIGTGVINFDKVSEEDAGKDITITIDAKTFLAKEAAKNKDTRMLGVCISKITLE